MGFFFKKRKAYLLPYCFHIVNKHISPSLRAAPTLHAECRRFDSWPWLWACLGSAASSCSQNACVCMRGELGNLNWPLDNLPVLVEMVACLNVALYQPVSSPGFTQFLPSPSDSWERLQRKRVLDIMDGLIIRERSLPKHFYGLSPGRMPKNNPNWFLNMFPGFRLQEASVVEEDSRSWFH